MSDDLLTPEILSRAVFDQRFNVLTRTQSDLGQIATWDKTLDRRQRLLVPIDVQAFVVPTSGGEPTVAVTGGASDPEPFAPGAPRPAGVHLHWALPDALLRGQQLPVPGEGSRTRLAFPELPDRWVVVRAVMPNGRRQALLRGWVIDARLGSVTPLASYAGTPAAPPPGTARLDPLNAAQGGSLLWTASYTASVGRFGFHDPLADLPGADLAPQGLHGGHAAYVVAGWWSELERDPLAASSGTRALQQRLEQLGWLVMHDVDDQGEDPEDPYLAEVRGDLNLSAPESLPQVGITLRDGSKNTNLHHVQLGAGVPVRHPEAVLVAPTRPQFAALLHGAVLGVPVDGRWPAGADDKPTPSDIDVAIGLDLDDLVAAFGADVLGGDVTSVEQRRAVEHLAAAFTSDLLDRLGSSDGIDDLEEREHGDQFTSLPGAPLPGAKPDRLRTEDGVPVGPTDVGRKGRAAARKTKKKPGADIGARFRWKDDVDLEAVEKASRRKPRSVAESDPETTGAVGPTSREVAKPAPRWFRPQPPMIALRGARPHHRHHGDGLFDASGRLRCRYPSECGSGWPGVVSGETVVPSLGSGAVPEEVLTVVREAVAINPYAYTWLASAGAPPEAPERVEAFTTRLAGEMVRLYGIDGRYEGTTPWLFASAEPAAPESSWARISVQQNVIDRQLTSAIAPSSLWLGTPPSPVAITTWRQPWVPLWIEWRVTLEGSDRIDGWRLDGLDLQAPEPETAALSRSIVGRSPIGQGISTALAKGIERWLAAEAQRDEAGASVLPDEDEAALERLADFLHPLDLVSASLDGIREQLLGIPYLNGASQGPAGADGRRRPTATASPVPLFGGRLRVQELRLVDAFGRVLAIPVAAIATTTDLTLPDVPNAIRLRPRFQHAARWLFRLVDPALPFDADPATAPEAYVDQLNPSTAVNPIAGYLLPDHIDEALEFFTVDGAPIGQLAHDPVSNAVFWEPAPGRPVPPDAGPLADLAPHDRILGELAAGVVRGDVTARAAATPPRESALTAMLRAIDSTLWTVDTFASLGSATLAGLVGRPIAVVRATLRLDVPDDLADVTVPDAAAADARRAAFAALAEQRFPLQLGSLVRSDDALLGFFVDDDYDHLHLVDKVVAGSALDAGRHRGHLGLLGQPSEPRAEPLDHPYVVPEDVLSIRPGQTLRLTLLLLPAGKVHLTSGILPRKALALNEHWVGVGLPHLMPSVRVGPVLVDPSEIRLPLVHTLGEKQTFTRRTGPLTWRDDPILAATQTALLPRLPHEVQEGWIRVTPEPTDTADEEEEA